MAVVPIIDALLAVTFELRVSLVLPLIDAPMFTADMLPAASCAEICAAARTASTSSPEFCCSTCTNERIDSKSRLACARPRSSSNSNCRESAITRDCSAPSWAEYMRACPSYILIAAPGMTPNFTCKTRPDPILFV